MRFLQRCTAAAMLASVVTVHACGAIAKSAAPSSPRTTGYEASFFAQFAPRTALDIVNRVPGFSLDLGNTDARGFASAAGNVVINGARPSSKSETLETILSKIPASSVTRVEIGPGDLYGAEYVGRSQVLNLLLSTKGGMVGNLTASARRFYNGYLSPNISASELITRGSSATNLSIGTGKDAVIEDGGEIDRRADGATLFSRRRKSKTVTTDPFVSASWALVKSSDRAFRINGRWSLGRSDVEQAIDVTSPAGAQHDDTLLQHHRDPVFEIGGDITRPFAGGALKLVGLATRRRKNDLDSYLGRNGLLGTGSTVSSGFEQRVNAHQGETIGRVTWTRSHLAGVDVETGAEGALNRLSTNDVFYAINSDGSLSQIKLPIERALVTEERGEAYANVAKSLSPRLHLDGGFAIETSRLSVSGDTSSSRSLTFIKPSFAIDWQISRIWHSRLSLRRTAAQLDFYDFISVAELGNGRINGGNAALVPQRAWEARMTIDRPLMANGEFKLDAGVDQIGKLQDQVLTVDNLSAPGNIGSGMRKFVAASLDLPLARLGLSGVRLKSSAQWQHTSVHDPISGRSRKFSGYYPDWQWSAELRRDAGSLSLGAAVSDQQRTTIFRADELDTTHDSGPYGTAFVEYRPEARTSVTFDVDNLFNTSSQRHRTFFVPNRTNPIPDGTEFRERNGHLNFKMTLKRTLGGANDSVRAVQAARRDSLAEVG